ncbi:MAG: transcription-repair coupling factor [Acidobacteriota bacterium]|nr:transcription-repair coupling factor [Blastocatellia bacterium]MDW8411499.1 transcription-repair coupling factor [Acidobacteriota bacterium]
MQSRQASFASSFTESASFAALLRDIRNGKNICVSGLLTSSARALFLIALEQLQRPVMLICRSNTELEQVAEDCAFFLTAFGSTSKVVKFPAHESDPYDGLSPHRDIEQQRVLALDSLARGEGNFLLLPAKALIERLPPPRTTLNLCTKLSVKEEVLLDELVEMLLATGYVREEPVTEVGTYSLRGGILDVFSPGEALPFRIEFFGDSIESIRTFDPDTQRSISRLESVRILPMRLAAVHRQELKLIRPKLEALFPEPKYEDYIQRLFTAAELPDGWEYLLPKLDEPAKSSIFDYLKNHLVVIEEPAETEDIIERFYSKIREKYTASIARGIPSLPVDMFFMDAESLRLRLHHRQRVELRALGLEPMKTDEEFAKLDRLYLFPFDGNMPEHKIQVRPVRKYRSDIPALAVEARKRHILIVARSLGTAERLVEVLREYGCSFKLCPDPSRVTDIDYNIVTIGHLSCGLEATEAGLFVLVEEDIYGTVSAEVGMRQPKLRRSVLASFLSDFRDLKPGDFVVHVDHGIGQFQGLQQIAVSPEVTHEFMVLSYADGGKLFVPVERLDVVQKYSSAEGNKPVLDRLGGTSWQKVKARAKAAIKDLAEELLKLYAERKLISRPAFGPDTAWQAEFEDAFEFQLTPDQEAAVRDIKRDLESDTPMDRLLCGDVGFGKTEVAMRAAFKVVTESKQVAVLAPTTVLAYQHYKTFQKRFASFPVVIELLSRFRSQKQQKELLRRLTEGKIDILIGTHRLLSKDVCFKDLGLLIIDEEQRFGVAHKERLKQMRKRVDVLTMSATPIPRTLNMSLIGLRDMSLIETPPSDRLAVQTYVVPFSEAVIKTALEVELQRGGQAFFVHNRVETIYTVAELINRLVPGVRIGVAHGQLNEEQLEEVMLRFIDHELDVLVTTTIIENGIDIPRANTILINRADTYGLAQLYQLRGRVGRSNRRAYAYLLIPSENTLSPVARKRLAAIREFSDLGSGFRIAALDLELRGAGNLLGAEQSGQIEAVGFDLYCQLLERTVQELRGEQIEDDVTNLNLGVDIRVPEDYISDISQRLRIYKRISTASTPLEVAAIREELVDRYGGLPESVENLFRLAGIKRLASRLAIASIDYDRGKLVIKFTEKSKVDPDKLVDLLSTNKQASFSPNSVLKINLEGPLVAESLFCYIENILLKLAKRE